MDELKKSLAKIAPWIIAWAMGLVTYYMAENTDKGFEALIAVVGIFG